MIPPPSPPSNLYRSDGPRFNSSLSIVFMVSVMTFFFMGFFSIYLKLCTERRVPVRNWDLPLNFGMPSSRLTRGLEESVIDSFPTFVYSTVKGLKTGKGTLECAICLNEFKDDETLRLIPKCNHVFHPDCIDAWLSSQATCPVCRTELAPNSGEIITSATVQVDNWDSEPENRPGNNNTSNETSEIAVDIESPYVNLINSNSTFSQNRPPGSSSAGWRLNRFLRRSHSTGHLLVQLGESRERFTLSLPEDVRSQLMDSSLSLTKSGAASPGARSARGYRTSSLERNYFSYKRFNQWGFTVTPFLTRVGSVESPQPVDDDGDEGSTTPPKGCERLFI
ncbi:hypothetical protein DITRI_Ditri03aG0168400 [Diplodiscus trichospermus]